MDNPVKPLSPNISVNNVKSGENCDFGTISVKFFAKRIHEEKCMVEIYKMRKYWF